MRFSVSVPCFFKNLDFTEAVYKTKELGFDAVEIWGWENLDLEKVKNVCMETNVELLSMCTSEFNMTEPSFRSEWLKGLRKSCEAAKKAGVGSLVTQSGSDTGAPRSFQHESIVKALNEAIPILEENGTMLMIEPLNIYVEHKDAYLWSSAEAFEIVREVNHPLVKIVYDIYHQQITEGNIIPNIVNNTDCIAHIHCAGHPGRIELQKGENDYNVIFEAIEKSDYEGACGLEYNPTMGSEESLKEFRKLYVK